MLTIRETQRVYIFFDKINDMKNHPFHVVLAADAVRSGVVSLWDFRPTTFLCLVFCTCLFVSALHVLGRINLLVSVRLFFNLFFDLSDFFVRPAEVVRVFLVFGNNAVPPESF